MARHSIMSNPASIARLVTTLAVLAGSAAALFYAQHDLTLSHYDARGHLMVARRVADSLTPGWQQLGGVWLPLPHLLNLLPAQWDWSYRTGFSGAVLSVLPLAAGLGAFAGYLARVTGSWAIAVATPLLILLNPNVLYLQSTPMTEPLLFALSIIAVVTMDRWMTGDDAGSMWRAGCALAALVLTRYEGWFVAAALLTLAAVAAPRRAARLVLIPGAAIVAFLFLSWGSTGFWFVASGFFEATNPALGQPWLAWEQVVEGATGLGGRGRLLLGFVGAGCCIVTAVYALARGGWSDRSQAARALLPLALAAAVVLPLYAFTNGHPVRVRYMISLVVAAAALSAFALMRLPRRLHTPAAAVVLAAAVWSTPPLDPDALMVREAQLERPSSDARREVTAALVERWDRTPVMASMGSLGHYMQQMSAHGFALKDFLHEGNGNLWLTALDTPRPYVRWILIEETAEGGDQLAILARAQPSFLEGFARVAASGGVALYARTSPPSSTRAGSHARRAAPAARTP